MNIYSRILFCRLRFYWGVASDWARLNQILEKNPGIFFVFNYLDSFGGFCVIWWIRVCQRISLQHTLNGCTKEICYKIEGIYLPWGFQVDKALKCRAANRKNNCKSWLLWNFRKNRKYCFWYHHAIYLAKSRQIWLDDDLRHSLLFLLLSGLHALECRWYPSQRFLFVQASTYTAFSGLLGQSLLRYRYLPGR